MNEPGNSFDGSPCGQEGTRRPRLRHARQRGIQSGLCLDVSGAATANGSAVILDLHRCRQPAVAAFVAPTSGLPEHRFEQPPINSIRCIMMA
ncbi:hypothetical protein [Phytohabitans kaempferiae]|uniref:Uncharacterized protein n=1 Tax=Phytohabitans kaempferiae TaxID=1620943 RepID=A0ABV6MIB3_9ACTN